MTSRPPRRLADTPVEDRPRFEVECAFSIFARFRATEFMRHLSCLDISTTPAAERRRLFTQLASQTAARGYDSGEGCLGKRQ